jgi:hypothetical protein
MKSQNNRQANHASQLMFWVTPILIVIYPIFPMASFGILSVISIYHLPKYLREDPFKFTTLNLFFVGSFVFGSFILFASLQGYYWTDFQSDVQIANALQDYAYWAAAGPIIIYFSHFWRQISTISSLNNFFILLTTKFFSALAFTHIYGLRADYAFSIYTLVATNAFVVIVLAEILERRSKSKNGAFSVSVSFIFLLCCSSSQSSALAILMIIGSVFKNRLYLLGILLLLTLTFFTGYLILSDMRLWMFDPNIALRWELYNHAIMLFLDSRGQGVGFGSSVVPLHFMSRSAHDFLWFDPQGSDLFSIGSHSTFFEATARFGVLGIILSFLLIVWLVQLLSRSKKSFSAFVAFSAALLILFFNMAFFSLNFSVAFYLCAGFLIFKCRSLNSSERRLISDAAMRQGRRSDLSVK